MVSLMLLSHSRKIAEGVKELCEEVSGGAQVIAVGGTKAGTLGSDFDAIFAQLEMATAKGEVIILADMGSSLLTAETAIDALDDNRKANVHLSPAALVEGGVMAAVSLAGGLDAAEVLEQLEEFRLSK
ncbi:MAG: dihydroxyacetone kinase phosphoryl donor subunit DhaM [Candidatus Pelethousia sp.]|nr:dihydroxyacetone kinase phosphoryl donor subunit DhaM [Candidatus Pelethousia sp.]